MKIAVFSILVLSWLSTANANILLESFFPKSCNYFFKRQPPTNEEMFVDLTTKRKVFVRIQRPEHAPIKGWFLPIHGLLSDQQDFEAVTNKWLEAGYGVVRYDIFGFGRSLPKQFSAKAIDYRDNVADLKALLEFLRDEMDITMPRLVGHSMGGLLAIAAAADPEIRRLITPRVTAIASYVYRLEYYALEKATTFGLGDLSHAFSFYQFMPNIIKNLSEEALGLMNDPHVHFFYGRFYDENVGQRKLSSDPRVNAANREMQILIGMAATRGLRDANAIELLKKVPPDFRLDSIYGAQDPLVEVNLQLKLARAIQNRGGRALKIRGGHMLPEEAPSIIAEETVENFDR